MGEAPISEGRPLRGVTDGLEASTRRVCATD